MAGDDTINFSVTGTITLGGTQLTINSNLTISGPGANQLTISGNDASRVFYIGSGTVIISGLTIADGNTAGGDGGGIYNAGGTLTLTNCTVSGNTAGDRGGGIHNIYSTATLTNCTISGNTASSGGGIYNYDADLTLANCTVSGNTASSGGGIYNYYMMRGNFKNTIIANNTATDEGPDCRLTKPGFANII